MVIFVVLNLIVLSTGKETIWRDESTIPASAKLTVEVQSVPLDWWDSAFDGCKDGWLYSPKAAIEQNAMEDKMQPGVKYWLGGVQSLTWIWTADDTQFNTYRGFVTFVDAVNVTNLVTKKNITEGFSEDKKNSAQACQPRCQFLFGLQGTSCYCFPKDSSLLQALPYRLFEKEMRCPGSYNDRCGNAEGMSVYYAYPMFPVSDGRTERHLPSVISQDDECVYLWCTVQMMGFIGMTGSTDCQQKMGFVCNGTHRRNITTPALGLSGTIVVDDPSRHFKSNNQQPAFYSIGFRFFDENVTWEEASNKCVLAKIGYYDFHKFTMEQLCVPPHKWSGNAWIGLKVQKTWKWLDGSDINSFISTSTTTGRGCLSVEKTINGIRLSRHNCSLMLPSICEKVSLPVVKTCNESSIMAAVAQQQVITHPNAGQCYDGTKDRAEAMLLTFCDAKKTTMWRPGLKVLDNCSTLPLHSPIATFQLGYYVQSDNGLAGIFLGCSGNGFSMAVQMCGQPPRIVYLISGQSSGFAGNADNYFVVTYNDYTGTPLIG